MASQSRVEHRVEVDSTNEQWLAQARRGLRDGAWLLAERQSGGRGRRGRIWQSAPGNLFSSVLIRQQAGEGPLPQLSFVAALALRQAVAAHVDPARLTLKWPNDLLLDGRKLAGILLETRMEPRETPWVVIGFGVNLAHHPLDVERPATSLAAHGVAGLAPAVFLPSLIDACDSWRCLWRRDGFPPIRQAWLQASAGVGKRLEARVGAVTMVGHMLDIAEDGALVLRLDNGVVETIHAGDVFAL